MFQLDTFDKIVESYFASITKTPFRYKKKEYKPKTLKVSSQVAGDITCPPNCGGCCKVNFLIWLPEELERIPSGVLIPVPTPRTIEFNGGKFTVFEDKQEDQSAWCRYRRSTDGRCDIHPHKPFAADFECLKFFVTKKSSSPNYLTQIPFPRKWSYTRVDGGIGGFCVSLPPTEERRKNALRRIYRLKEWAEFFKVDHCLGPVIEYLETGLHPYSIIVNEQQNEFQVDLFLT